MRTADGYGAEIAERLGADRVLEPVGSLPQPAERLDASGPVRRFELELAVERLCLDSTSHREIRARTDGDADRMAARILEIVRARGKMHNPATDSGGILLGTVESAGEGFSDRPPPATRIVTLASLTLTPLRLEAITGLDPASPQVDVTGTAYVFDRAPWAALPDDIPLGTALDLFDVCSAASHTRALAPADGTVCVLGAGHAGRLALAAARDSMEAGTVVAVDVDPEATERVTSLGLCDIGVTADLRNPLATLREMRSAGVPAADLTVVVVNAADCEPTAILITAGSGTVLFFSMATNFSAAALTPDGLSSEVRMLIGSGYAPDRGAYALDLFRRTPALRECFGVQIEEPA